MVGKRGISRSGTGSQSIGVSRAAVTHIHPNEAQGTAGAPIQSTGSVGNAFEHMVGWDAPGLEQDCKQGICFGDGFQKP